jgi:hypothetical protein
MFTGQGQRIEDWGVVANDRLSGAVHNRAGHRDGAMIVTSPVVEIRLMGSGDWSDTYPVAFTESGNAYRLGQPSNSFGIERAEQFINAKLTGPSAPVQREAKGFNPDITIVRAAVDTSLHNYDCIDVYETSFKPL